MGRGQLLQPAAVNAFVRRERLCAERAGNAAACSLADDAQQRLPLVGRKRLVRANLLGVFVGSLAQVEDLNGNFVGQANAPGDVLNWEKAIVPRALEGGEAFWAEEFAGLRCLMRELEPGHRPCFLVSHVQASKP